MLKEDLKFREKDEVGERTGRWMVVGTSQRIRRHLSGSEPRR